MNETPRTPILGVGISAVNLAAATDQVMEWIATRRPTYVAVTDVRSIVAAQNDPAFRGFLNRSGLTVPDGMPLVWLSKLAGRGHVTRVCGTDLTLSVSAALARTGKAAFYYGAGPGTAVELARRLEQQFPGLRTAGAYSPPFRPLTRTEEREIADAINRTAPDVVWVGLSTPKQEHWMVRFRPLLHAPVLIGVGAAFDFITGRVRRAPAWVQKTGFEWLYRVAQEPRRLAPRYLRSNSRFVYGLVSERLRSSSAKPKASDHRAQ